MRARQDTLEVPNWNAKDTGIRKELGIHSFICIMTAASAIKHFFLLSPWATAKLGDTAFFGGIAPLRLLYEYDTTSVPRLDYSGV